MSSLVNRTIEVTSKEWVSLHPNPQKVAKSEAGVANKEAQSQVTKEDGQHNKGALSRYV